MVKRIITGIGLLGITLLFIYLTSFHEKAMDALIVLFTIVSSIEMYFALKKPFTNQESKIYKVFCVYVDENPKKYDISIIPIIIELVSMYVLISFFNYYGIIFSLLISFVTLFIIFIFKPEKRIEDFFANIFILIYPIVTNYLAIILLQSYGVIPVVLALAISAVSDTSAYFIGSMLGKRKIFPKISPKKTYAGCIGGLFGGAVGGILVYLIFELAKFPSNTSFTFSELFNDNIGLTIGIYAVIGFVVAIFSEIGDLAASRIKREVGIKDYSKLLGSHGGFMDRIDSVQFTFICIYIIMIIIDISKNGYQF